jgi:hypothetical protein
LVTANWVIVRVHRIAVVDAQLELEGRRNSSKDSIDY